MCFVRCEPLGDFMYAGCSHSKNQRIFDVYTLFYSVMLHFFFVVVTESVQSETVFILIYFLAQSVFQNDILRLIDDAFKNRILNTHAVVLTYLCDSPEPFLTAGFGKRYVVGYKN